MIARAIGHGGIGRMTALFLAGALGFGCESTLDIDRARRVLERPATPAAPLVRDDLESDLPAVEGLRAGSGELRAIPLRWQPVLDGDVTGYLVERARSAGAPYERIAVVSGRFGTVYVDRGQDNAEKAGPGLGDGESYIYRVRAVDRLGGNGAPSLSEIAQTAALPERPTAFRAISQLPRRVALSWEPSTDRTVSGYVVSRSPSELGEFLPIVRLNGRFATTYVDAGLGDLRVFYYRVAAQSAAGATGEARHAERAVTKPEPLPPARVSARPESVGRNDLAWQPNVERDLAGYYVSRIAGDGTLERIAEVAADVTRFADDGVAAGETVSYLVEAFDRDGLISPAAGPFEVESLGYGLSASIATEGVRLTWDPASGAPSGDGASAPRFAAIRVWRVGPLTKEAIAETASGEYVDLAPGSGRRRYQVAGVHADGTLAPISRLIEIEVPPSVGPAASLD